MIPLKWVERTFNFDFPIGLFPAILERLRGTPARLEEMIASYRPDILTVKINAGWSIQEHAGHLHDLDELHLGRLDDFLVRLPVLRAWDITNRKTSDANHNGKPVKEILSAFRTQRIGFVHRLENLDADTVSITALHPRLQKQMRVVDMAYFVAEHDDHHLAVISHLSQTV